MNHTPLLVPQPKTVVRPKRCETCGCLAVRPLPGGAGVQLECRRLPPTSIIAPGPQGQFQVLSVWPAMERDQWCVEGWRARIEIAETAN